MWFFSLIIGILKIVVVLLTLILLMIALVIFVPVRYEIYAEKHTAVQVEAAASWFFRALKAEYTKTHKKSSMKISVFGKLIGKGKKKKEKNTAVDTAEEPTIANDPTETEEPKVKNESSGTKKTKTESKPKTKDKPKDKNNTVDTPDENTAEASEPEEGIFKKITAIYNYPDRDALIRLTLELCKKLLLALKPTKFVLKAEFGTGDPALTGSLLGFIESIKPFTGLEIYTVGNFEKSVLNGDTTIEGKLFLYKFIYPLCRYALSKPVWKLIKKYYFKKDDENEYQLKQQS